MLNRQVEKPELIKDPMPGMRGSPAEHKGRQRRVARCRQGLVKMRRQTMGLVQAAVVA